MFFEVLLNTATFVAAGFEGREHRRRDHRINALEDCVAALRTMLRSLRAPSDTIIKSGPPNTRTWTLQET